MSLRPRIEKKFPSMQARKSLKNIKTILFSDRAQFWAFAVFLTMVFLTGGGSRDDIQSLVLLRPLSIIFLAYALMSANASHWKGRLYPAYLLLALAGLMVLQLLPLPPELWTALPGRQIFAQIADLAAIDQPWRPLTLSPSKTLNSLFSLTVPLAAMLLYLNLQQGWRIKAVQTLIILICLSAFLAIIQILGPPRSLFYLYRITNEGSAVGLFANRNHQAVVLAILIGLLGWYANFAKRSSRSFSVTSLVPLAGVFVIVPLLLVTGSRAGLLLMAVSLAMTLFFVFSERSRFASRGQAVSTTGKNLTWKISPSVIVIGLAILISALIFAAVVLSRSLAFDRLFPNGDVEELRVQLIPILLAMIRNYMPFGIGFGAFEHVYKIYEPLALLNPNYLNQAHNDWMQVIVEGGLPVLLIIAAAVLWYLWQLILLAKRWNAAGRVRHEALLHAVTLIMIAAASAGDYPLRVPIVMSLFALTACFLNDTMRQVRTLRDTSET